ncbi:glutathione S-transferase [Hoeflea marina]|uniref:Glutathione S-transferase n=1 Tax=Hoeflea marina TaxID=274592 RepID=A0A317PL13_9HYPH|nr:glutathione S-transferase family protein [Hoeflea marina]PWW00468.1 glutathione S-transferase [Hoeflea marina]
MPVLYHHPASAASRFIRLCFAEMDFEADMIEERTWEKRAEFLRLNPAGHLPVCVAANGQALCGPHVIAEYLDESFGVFKRDRRLLAEDPYKRAETRRLIEWFLIKFEHDVTTPLTRERVIKPQMRSDDGGGAPDSKVLRTARANIRQHLKYLSWLAGSRPWLAGDRLSYADLAAAAAISVLDYLGEVDWKDSPQAKDWYQRVKSRPSFRPLLSDRIRNMPPVAHYADLDF